MLLDMNNGATNASVAPFSQPNGVAYPVSGTFLASSNQDAEMGVVSGVADNYLGDSHDPIGAGDGVLFRPFKHLPGEVRTMIWKAAAASAKPRGVYQFKVKHIKLGLASNHYPLAQSMFTNIRRLDDNSPLVREIRDLMQSVYTGDSVSTFTPLPEVGRFTLEIRNLLRSCPEARSELVRTPAFGSSFSFHWFEGGKCDLGVVRPFCYDTDWISLTEVAQHLTIRPSAPGVLCTPDIAAIEHLAIPHLECFCTGDWSRLQAQLRTLAVFPSLRSLGIYDSCLSVKRVSHWDRLITEDQRYFLKGVSTSASGARPGRRLTGARFSGAMGSLKRLILEVAVKEIMNKLQSPRPASLAGLNFCLLLHASSQAGLDLMKFREDGSHLDDVARIQDLGVIGQEVKALRINGARP
ncbi:hypothetical protein INS49_005365 [Diaporthe citri]|uniref:uncharacterized protein n=1 Tax=Diaporthe citri TaxID=83186 RepID=UPI001C7ECB25|nr:uncharacterized protein INS49_005365 [Diaporthe citri]KAG6353657.1 hypothetical protein INS49_005365 [Diaporthe citri]